MAGDAGRFAPSWALPSAVAAISTAVYCITLAPTVASSRDSAELALVAIELGVAHPTGYPLYTLLGHAWVTAIGFGEPGWRLNLLSAICAGLAMGLLADLVRRLTRRAEAAWLAAGVFAFSPLVWQEATVAEVYAPHLLLQVAIVWCWTRWEEGDGEGWLYALALCVGLSFAHHLMTTLLLPAIVLALWIRRSDWWSPRRAIQMAIWGGAPLALYAYIPVTIASGTTICWSDLETPSRIFSHILGGGYGGSNLQIGGASFWEQAARYPRGITSQFGVALLLVPLGLASQRNRRHLLGALALGYAVSLIFALSYRVIDPDPFYLTSCLFLALWIGAGAGWVLEAGERWPSWLRRSAQAVLIVLPVVPLTIHFAAQDRSDDFRVLDRDMAALATAGLDSVFLTWGDNNFPLYLQRVHGVRPDLEIVNLRLTLRCDLPSELEEIRRTRSTLLGEGLGETLDALQTLGGRPRALVAAPIDAGSGWERHGLVVVDEGALIRLQPIDAASRPDAHRPTAGSQAEPAQPQLVRVIPASHDVLQGDVVELRYEWSGLSPSTLGSHVVSYLGDTSLAPAVHLDPTQGTPAFQVEHRLGQGRVAGVLEPSGALVEEFARAIPHDLPEGEWTLWVRAPGAERPSPAFVVRVEESARAPWQLPRVRRISLPDTE